MSFQETPEEENTNVLTNTQTVKNKQSIFKVVLYVVLLCSSLVLILVILILIRRTAEKKDDVVSKNLQQRERELMEANNIIAQLKANRKPKKSKMISSIKPPIFTDVVETDDIPGKRDTERKVLMKIMNKERETVQDIFDAEKRKNDEIKEARNIKYNPEKSEDSEEDESEESINDVYEKQNKDDLEKTLLSTGELK
jgi:hypothetical protein